MRTLGFLTGAIGAALVGGAWTQASDGCEPGWAPAIGQPGANNQVFALRAVEFADGPRLIAGGSFSQVDGVARPRIAAWDGESWSGLGGGANNIVFALEPYEVGGQTMLIAGGDFTSVGFNASRIARFDGDTWSPMGAGVNAVVRALKVYDPGDGERIYVGGAFHSAGGMSASRIAAWDGESWETVGDGMNISGIGAVLALEVFDDGAGPALYAGGVFVGAGGVPAANIARWDGESWSPLGAGVNGQVNALAVFDDGDGPALYVAGAFTTAGGAPASRIARWKEGGWSALGAGVTDTVPAAEVRALHVFDDGDGPALYAGGLFFNIGGVQSSGIARWTGDSWSPVSVSGVGSPGESVRALDSGRLTKDPDETPRLWMGGEFSSAGGAAVGNIVAWRGCAIEDPGGDLPADINGDGSVGAQDLGILLGSWGPCPSEPQSCPADINGDGVVNAADLGILLGFWGATADG